MASAGSRWNTCTNVYATPGMMMNWAAAPMQTSKGRWARIRKSSVVRVMPMVSMIRPRMMVCVNPETHSNVAGTKNVNTAMAMTNHDV